MMKIRSSLALVMPFVLLASMECNAQNNSNDKDNIPDKAGVFDFYKLTFSREKEWCYSKGISASQCSSSKEYVIHGLWPEFESGYPESCALEADSGKDQQIEEAIKDIIPSNILEHEWQKHGYCSGLSRADYFRAIININKSVKMPPLEPGNYTIRSIKKAVTQSNPNITANQIQLSCRENNNKKRFPRSSNQTLDEIRICYKKDLSSTTACGSEADLCDTNLKVRY